MTREEAIVKLREIFQMVVHNGVDSIGLIYLAIAVEKVFEVDLSHASINSFKTVGDVVTFICDQKG